MTKPIALERFLSAQRDCYNRVKQEMEAGHKRSCWIWFIFPQILFTKGRVSETHKTYAIHSIAEAQAYLNHSILGTRLLELTRIVLTHRNIPIETIMGTNIDALKFKSSMTLFSLISPEGSVFHQVLDHFFKGKRCPTTMAWTQKVRPIQSKSPVTSVRSVHPVRSGDPVRSVHPVRPPPRKRIWKHSKVYNAK